MGEQIYIIMAKVLHNEATGEERAQLDAWLAADPANKAEFDAVKGSWTEVDGLMAGPSFDTAAAWEKVSAATGISDTPKTAKTIAFPSWMKVGLGTAAALAIGFFVYNKFSQNDLCKVVAADANKEVILPDNSHVVLHKGSSIEYPAQFASNERHVVLHGEAFFDVTHDKSHPFSIEAGVTEVKVLGTSFNVNETGTEAVVTVATGCVQMAEKANGQNSQVLNPGEQGVLKKGSVTKSNVSSDGYLYWKTGVVAFSDQPCSHIISELQDLSGATIHFDASVPESVKQGAINATEYKGNLSETLSEIAEQINCRVVSEGNNYTFVSK